MAKEVQLPPLSDAQVEIMRIIWAQGDVSVADVWEALSKERPVARNTVLTVMDRLAKRGWLSKRRDGNKHIYRAKVSEETTMRDVVRRLIDTVFGGSADSLMVALLAGRGVTKAEAGRIQELIKQARDKSG